MAICAEAAYSHYLSRMAKPPAPMLADYDSEIREHDAFVLKLECASHRLLVLHVDQSGVLLDNVAVQPEYQGRGYGKQLLAFAEQETLGRGFDRITLYTNEVMTENIGLYTRMGYVEFERVVIDGYHRVYMRKQLTK